MKGNQNEQYLKILSIFHYIVGGLVALFSLSPITIYLDAGLERFVTILTEPHSGPPFFLSQRFLLFAIAMQCVFVLAGWALAICIVLTGVFMAKRKNYKFCVVITGVECILIFFGMPFGSILGAMSIIFLLSPSVKEMFESKTPDLVAKATG